MLALMIILTAAAVGHGLATWRRLPVIPVLVGMGILLDAAGIAGPIENRQDMLRLGLTFVLFMVGSQLDPALVGSRRRASLFFGLGQFVVIGGSGVFVAHLLGFDLRAALYVGLALASSSTIVVLGLLRSREQVFEDLGRVAIGVVLLQDLLVILLLPVVGAEDLMDAGRGLLATMLLIAAAGLVARVVIPALLRPLEGEGEALLLATLAVLFAFAGLADAVGVRPEIGAFIGGLSMARFPVNGIIRGPTASLADFFTSVFCVSLGTLVGIDDLPRIVLPALAIVAIVLLTPFLLVPLGRLAGLTTRSSLELTGLLAQCGELAVAVMLLGLLSGHVPEALFREVALVAIVTMLLAPVISSDRAVNLLMHLGWRRRIPRGLPQADGAVVFVGAGPSARGHMRRLREAGSPVLAIDDDPTVVRALREEGIPVVRGEGGDPRLLHAIGIRRAATIVCTVRRRRDQERLVRLAGSVPVILRTFDADAAAELRELGAVSVSEAEAGAESFGRWFDEDDPAAAGAEGAPAD